MPKKLYQLLPIVVLLTGVTAAALAQTPAPSDADSTNAGKPSLMSRFFPGSQKKNDETPKSTEPAKGKPGVTPTGVKQTEVAGKILEAELETWHRREAVCLRLQEIAAQTGDEKLWRTADQLSSLAREAYQRRLAQQTAGLTDTAGTPARPAGAASH